MWNAMVRPTLEYAGELWGGEISDALTREVEKVQTDFGRIILGIKGEMWVPAEFVRAELGMESLEARRQKLRLGFWRRLQTAQPRRALSQVANMHREEVRVGRGRWSWMWGTRDLLVEVGLGWFWRKPNESAYLDKEIWRRTAGYRVDRRADVHRETRMATMRTMGNYNMIKDWDEWPAWKATKRSEVGRLGAMVSEPYLDETGDRLGRTLMTKCRARSLPVMARVRDEMNLPAAKALARKKRWSTYWPLVQRTRGKERGWKLECRLCWVCKSQLTML